MTFTAWEKWKKPWRKRGALECYTRPGVYVLAIFRQSVPQKLRLNAREVIYIGETTPNTLLGRWRRFQRALDGKFGHSGGKTCRKQLGPKVIRHLYVSTFAPQLKEPHRSAYIRHLERKLIWEYVQRWGRGPKCNSK
jgi:hypothetical protein